MSVPAPVGARPRLSRRSALLALGALTLAAGCTTDDESGDRRDRTGGAPGPDQDPNVVVATEALAAQREMKALLAAIVARHPALEERLSAVTSAHAAHIAMLDGAVPSPSVPSPSVSASTSPGTGTEESEGPPPAGSLPAVPRRPGPALTRIVVEEQSLAVTLKQLAFRAPSGPFARLLGSMAASTAQHSAALTTGAAGASTGARP